MKYLCLYFLSTLFAFAQVQEELQVTVREMRVHVIDNEGNPVKGLRPTDFVLKSRKTPIELSFFEEVNLLDSQEDEAAIAETEVSGFIESDNVTSRKIVLFVDSSHLTPKNFETIKTSLKDFIREKVRPQDRLSLYHSDEKVAEMAGFYQSRQAVLEAIDDMKFVGRMRRELIKAQKTIHGEIKNWSFATAQERPSYESLINQLIKEKGRLKASHYRTFYLNMLSVAYTLEQMSGPKSIFLFTGGSYLEFSSLYGQNIGLSERLGQVLNRANATIYTVLVKKPHPVGGELTYVQNMDPRFARQLKHASKFPPGGPNSLEIASNTISENTSALESGPDAAARETGGLFLTAKTDERIADQFDKAERVSSHYYRFAFDLEETKKETKVKVSLKEEPNGWKLLYGQEIANTQAHADLEEEERNMAFLSTLLYSSKYRDDFDSVWDAKVFERGDQGFRVAMMGRFEAPKSFKKGMEIGFAALAADRSLLDVATTVVSKVPVKDEFAFYDILLTQKQPTYLRYYARSLDTGDYAIHEIKVDYQPGQGETRLSEILMDEPREERILSLNQLSFVKQESKTIPERIVLRSELDPFRMNDKVYAPQVAPYAFNPGIAGFMFHLENPEPEDEATYEVQYLIKSPSGYEKVPGRVITSWRDSVGNIRFHGQIKTDVLEKGSYSLLVKVQKTGTQEHYTQGVAFELN